MSSYFYLFFLVLTAMKKTFVKPAASDKQNKGTFYRKSTSSAAPPRVSSGKGPPGGSELSTVIEAESSEESITSLERHTNDMTLSEGQNEACDQSKQQQDLMNHCTPSCSQADHDSLSLRSSPSGASTSSSASFPAVLLVNQQQLDSKQSSDSNDSDHKDNPAVPAAKNPFCFNFEIKADDIDHGPPAKKKPGGKDNRAQSAKQPKEDTGSSEGSPMIGDLAEKKGSKKGGGRRRRSKKKQQEKLEGVVVENSQKQCEKQEIPSTGGSGQFQFNFPEPSSTS